MLLPTSIANASRVHSSTSVRHLSCCPLAHVSNTKSRPGRGSAASAEADVAGSRQFVDAVSDGKSGAPHAATVGAHGQSPSRGLRARGRSGCVDTRTSGTARRARASASRLARPSPRAAIGTAAMSEPREAARTLVDTTGRASARTPPAAVEPARLPFFLAAISFITSISGSRSATILFSRPFSASRAFRRFVSVTSIAPNRFRHVYSALRSRRASSPPPPAASCPPREASSPSALP
jgi:hypothetical protein